MFGEEVAQFKANQVLLKQYLQLFGVTANLSYNSFYEYILHILSLKKCTNKTKTCVTSKYKMQIV
jgi:hypothetical protein